jgi:hypothetical protein
MGADPKLDFVVVPRRTPWRRRTISRARLLFGVLIVIALLDAAPSQAAASSVISPGVTPTSTAAGATGVSYLVDVTLSRALKSGDSVTIAAPNGTKLPSQSTKSVRLSTVIPESGTLGRDESGEIRHGTLAVALADLDVR